MIWETQISHIVINKNGNDRIQKDSYIVENCETFTEVEEKLLDTFSAFNSVEPIVIKISKIKEIINESPQGDDCKIYFATIVDKFYDEEKDETKELKYIVALFAHDINEAHQNVTQYMMQGLEDMELKQLKETKYIGLIK